MDVSAEVLFFFFFIKSHLIFALSLPRSWGLTLTSHSLLNSILLSTGGITGPERWGWGGGCTELLAGLSPWVLTAVPWQGQGSQHHVTSHLLPLHAV